MLIQDGSLWYLRPSNGLALLLSLRKRLGVVFLFGRGAFGTHLRVRFSTTASACIAACSRASRSGSSTGFEAASEQAGDRRLQHLGLSAPLMTVCGFPGPGRC